MPTTPPVVGVAMGVGEEITEADDALLTILRYTREDLEAGRLNWAEMTPPEFLHLDLAGTRQAAASGGFTVPYQKEFLRRDGTRVPVLMACAFVPETPGQWMCYVVDLSPPSVQRALPSDARAALGRTPTPHDFYARLVNELVRERTRTLAMLDNTATLFWAVDRELRLLGANAAFQAAQGETIGHPLPIGESVLTPEFSPEVRAVWERNYARALAGERFSELTAHATPEGTRYYESAFSPILDPQEGVAGVSVVSHDVTARRHAEEALRTSEARFRTLAAASPLGIWLSDTHGEIVYFNPRLSDIWRLAPGEMFDRASERYIHPDDLTRVVEAWQRAVEDGVSLEQEFRLRFPDGAERQVRSRMAPVHEEGRLTGFVGTVDDDTERRALEQRVRQSEKMESLGVLAGGIAHDFNNMLGVVLGHAELALGDASALVPEEHPLSESLREIRTASLRARDLVRQILTFSRRSEQQTAPVDLRALTVESLRLLRATLPSTVALDTRLPDDSVTVLGDASALQQVIVNLCTNAEYAMRAGGGGCLTVSLEVERRGGPAVAVLTVRDTGRGIPAHVRERLFEPFFTTKPPGEGTGMGLAVAHGIITAHGGAIAVDGAPGSGAVFRVSLPLAPTPDLPESVAAPEVRGRGRVMLVEDEPALARFATQALTRGGYIVTYCRDGIEALRLLDAPNPAAIDVVVSDVTMPGLTGDKLARELQRLRPELPVILTTGFSHLVTPEAMRALGVVALLHKPFSARDLVTAVHDAMERAPGRVP